MKMRAKMKVSEALKGDGFETLKMNAVGPNESYPEDGSDENNTFAKWTPSAQLEMHISNPDLHGKFEVDQEFYVDFTPA